MWGDSPKLTLIKVRDDDLGSLLRERKRYGLSDTLSGLHASTEGGISGWKRLGNNRVLTPVTMATSS